MSKNLYLIGYQGKTIDDFVRVIKKWKITSVVDVREKPLSRKNGFSKNILKDRLFSDGIKYHHFPSLGSPSQIRKELWEGGDYLVFFKKYRDYIKGKKKDANKVVKLIRNNGNNTALMCFEQDSQLCHRSIVASEIMGVAPEIKTTPL